MPEHNANLIAVERMMLIPMLIVTPLVFKVLMIWLIPLVAQYESCCNLEYCDRSRGWMPSGRPLEGRLAGWDSGGDGVVDEVEIFYAGVYAGGGSMFASGSGFVCGWLKVLL